MVVGAIVRVAVMNSRGLPCGPRKYPDTIAPYDRTIGTHEPRIAGQAVVHRLPAETRSQISRVKKGRILYPTEGK
jgi:hypothetical protein